MEKLEKIWGKTDVFSDDFRLFSDTQIENLAEKSKNMTEEEKIDGVRDLLLSYIS